jgi:predicted transcriptional regulator
VADGSRTYTASNKAEVAEQARRCYELKLAGWSHDRIAEELGISHGTVQNRIDAHIAVRVNPLADQLRAEMVARFAKRLAKLDAQIEDDEHAHRLARNIEVATKVEERWAKLLGVDAPERIEATVTEVTQEDVALAELVAEARAASAVAEAQLRGGA